MIWVCISANSAFMLLIYYWVPLMYCLCATCVLLMCYVCITNVILIYYLCITVVLRLSWWYILQKCLVEHQVNRISFISKDCTDSRSFSYVVGNTGGKHVLYGIKTDKPVSVCTCNVVTYWYRREWVKLHTLYRILLSSCSFVSDLFCILCIFYFVKAHKKSVWRFGIKMIQLSH